MFIDKEEREKYKKRLKESDAFLESILNLMPRDTETDFMRYQHKFQIVESQAIDEFIAKKLSGTQTKQLISFYEQATKIIKDILNNKG